MIAPMDDQTLRRINATFDALERRFDDIDHQAFDVDSGDGKLTLDFEDGAPLIISRQSAAGQIWVAEPRGGWHFTWDDERGAWVCDKRDVELIASLEDLIEAKLGERLTLA